MAWFRAETSAQSRFLREASGANRIVLRGRVVTMNDCADVIEDGLVVIEGTRIVSIGPIEQALKPEFAGIPPIVTHGTIYPGLIELHNHPSYNAIPLWQVPKAFPNRKVWRSDPDYRRRVSGPAALLTHDPTSDTARAVVRFVECRALLGGVTTTQGLSVTKMDDGAKATYRGLVRNLELPDDPTWPVAEDRIDDFKSADEANRVYGPLLDDPHRPFIMHLSEGVDQDAREVFEFLRDPGGRRLLGRNFVGVHGTGLDAEQITALAVAAGLVWSPLSNFLLYGATTNVATAKAAGVPLALGSDWGPSGTKNLLGELKIARIVSDYLGDLFSDLELVRMVTTTPARMVGWHTNLGSLEAGKLADLLILEGSDGDPYQRLVAATERDVVAVVIDGRPRAGRATVLDPRTTGVELLHVAGQNMVLDLIESPVHPLAGVSLGSAIATLSFALAHLPDLAARFALQHSLLDDGRRFFVRLDLDEEHAMALVAGERVIGAADVDPMQLDPITAVDDPAFGARLSANPNLPTWLHERLA